MLLNIISLFVIHSIISLILLILISTIIITILIPIIILDDHDHHHHIHTHDDHNHDHEHDEHHRDLNSIENDLLSHSHKHTHRYNTPSVIHIDSNSKKTKQNEPKQPDNEEEQNDNDENQDEEGEGTNDTKEGIELGVKKDHDSSNHNHHARHHITTGTVDKKIEETLGHHLGHLGDSSKRGHLAIGERIKKATSIAVAGIPSLVTPSIKNIDKEKIIEDIKSKLFKISPKKNHG